MFEDPICQGCGCSLEVRQRDADLPDLCLTCLKVLDQDYFEMFHAHPLHGNLYDQAMQALAEAEDTNIFNALQNMADLQRVIC